MDQWVAGGGRRLDEQTEGWKEGSRGGGRLDVQVEGGRGTLLVTVTRNPPTKGRSPVRRPPCAPPDTMEPLLSLVTGIFPNGLFSLTFPTGEWVLISSISNPRGPHILTRFSFSTFSEPPLLSTDLPRPPLSGMSPETSWVPLGTWRPRGTPGLSEL